MINREIPGVILEDPSEPPGLGRKISRLAKEDRRRLWSLRQGADRSVEPPQSRHQIHPKPQPSFLDLYPNFFAHQQDPAQRQLPFALPENIGPYMSKIPSKRIQNYVPRETFGLGDSHTKFIYEHLGRQAKRKFPNLSKSSMKSGYMRDQLKRYLSRGNRLPEDFVVALGANDNNPAKSVPRNIARIIEMAQKGGAKRIVVSGIPEKTYGGPRSTRNIRQANSILRERFKNMPGVKFVGVQQELGPLNKDGIHYGKRGYLAMHQKLKDAFKDMA